jgi:hypothetical protein
MVNFFLTITITAGAIAVILVYYTIRNGLSRRRHQKMANASWRKLYLDEENYLRSRFRSLLSELTSGNIQWIILQSKIKPHARFEITSSSLYALINIIFVGRELSATEKNDVANMGADKYETNDENSIIYCESNSKIICDVIFYLMDKIFDLKNIKNVNLKISGRT